jgi:Ca-activated chloride channel family protein
MAKTVKRQLSHFLWLAFAIAVSADAGMLDYYHLKRAEAAYERGDYEKAAESFSALDGRDARYNAANSYYKAGKYEKALALYGTVRSSDPDFKAALYFNMANCYIRLQEFEKAREQLLNSLTLRYDREADENLRFIAKAEEQDHLITGRQEGKKRAQESEAESSDASKKRKEGGGSNQPSDADAAKGAGGEGKKAKADPRLSFSKEGEERLSSRQYELINQRSINETRPW